MKERDFRGGSEPPICNVAVPVLPADCSSDFNDKSGLRKVPTRIAGVTMGSQDCLNNLGDDDVERETAWKNWRSVTPNRKLNAVADHTRAPNVAAQTPFGGDNLGHRPLVCRRMQYPTRGGKKSSSVSNLVAALESEISTWQSNNVVKRDYSANLGWNNKKRQSEEEEVEVASRKLSEPARSKFEPRKNPELRRFFTFGEAVGATASEGEDNNNYGEADLNGNYSAQNGHENGHRRQMNGGTLSKQLSVERESSSGGNFARKERRRSRHLSEINGGKTSSPVVLGLKVNGESSDLIENRRHMSSQSFAASEDLSNEQTSRSESEAVRNRRSESEFTAEPSRLSMTQSLSMIKRNSSSSSKATNYSLESCGLENVGFLRTGEECWQEQSAPKADETSVTKSSDDMNGGHDKFVVPCDYHDNPDSQDISNFSATLDSCTNEKSRTTFSTNKSETHTDIIIADRFLNGVHAVADEVIINGNDAHICNDTVEEKTGIVQQEQNTCHGSVKDTVHLEQNICNDIVQKNTESVPCTLTGFELDAEQIEQNTFHGRIHDATDIEQNTFDCIAHDNAELVQNTVNASVQDTPGFEQNTEIMQDTSTTSQFSTYSSCQILDGNTLDSGLDILENQSTIPPDQPEFLVTSSTIVYNEPAPVKVDPEELDNKVEAESKGVKRRSSFLRRPIEFIADSTGTKTEHRKSFIESFRKSVDFSAAGTAALNIRNETQSPQSQGSISPLLPDVVSNIDDNSSSDIQLAQSVVVDSQCSAADGNIQTSNTTSSTETRSENSHTTADEMASSLNNTSSTELQMEIDTGIFCTETVSSESHCYNSETSAITEEKKKTATEKITKELEERFKKASGESESVQKFFLDDEGDDIIEVDPASVKIHESVVPTFMVTRNPIKKIDKDHMSYAQESKMKENLFASLLRVSEDRRSRSSDRSTITSTAEEEEKEKNSSLDKDLVISKAETLAFEDLFEKLVASECSDEMLDIPPHLEEVTFGGAFSSTEKSVSREDRLRQKRRRHLTIDYHDLSPRSWNGTVSECTQKTYCKEMSVSSAITNNKSGDELLDQAPSETSEDGLGQGLGIILDKLKNIETKLDEIKDLEEQNICIATGNAEEARHACHLPELGHTPLGSSNSSLQILTHVTSDSTDHVAAKKFTMNKSGFLVDCGINTSHNRVDSDNDAFSVTSSNNDTNLHNESVIADTSNNTVDDFEDDVSDAETLTPTQDDGDDNALEHNGSRSNVLVSSPSPVSSSHLSSDALVNLDIVSVKSTSDDEEDELSSEERRNMRIEALAQQIMKERQKLDMLEEEERKKKDGGRPILVNVDAPSTLDTLSERSDEDAEAEGCTAAASDFSNRQSQQRPRPRRTRSSSRDRSLAKIRYCWRCHQTGHESFDCSAQVNPGNWCPRCLEKQHWEDDCWVNDKQVLCTICTLPGHLPCVHETSDFRQRKLVVETFGWLAFKEWFREPDFWSWWNVSGYTNVPLYKLMQHHRSKEI